MFILSYNYNDKTPIRVKVFVTEKCARETFELCRKAEIVNATLATVDAMGDTVVISECVAIR